MSPSVTNPTIADIYQSIQSNRLVLAPDFQRKFVWTPEHQEAFLDTVLQGYPFPEIYVCQGEININALITTQKVIDGQQRLTTIKRYIDGVSTKVSSKFPLYASLTQEEKKNFLSYQMVVRDIGVVDDIVVREVFRRINLTKFQLENVEIHNAIYDGVFIQTAKNLLSVADLQQYGVFFESEFTRMADLHFILLVMATLQNGGYFAEDTEIENQIAKNNDEYPDSGSMNVLMTSTFDVIKGMKLEADSLWLRKSNFFTLVVEIAKHIKSLPKDLKKKLESLDEKVSADKKNSGTPYGRYYQYMYQGTNQRKARVIRSELFCHEIFGAPQPTT